MVNPKSRLSGTCATTGWLITNTEKEYAHEVDTSKLLAKAVMKFARHANDKPEEKEITYGRIVTGHVIGWMANQLQREGRTDVSLYTLLEFIDNMTVEQLMLQSKILMNA